MENSDLLELQWMEHSRIFSQAINSLRTKDTFTDATLACEGKFYPVHKFVLSTCSDYFHHIFEWTPCVSPVIVINNVHCKDLESLLDFMYLGEASVKETDLTSVMKTAESLRVKGLAILENDTFSKSLASNLCSPNEPNRKKPRQEQTKCVPLQKSMMTMPLTESSPVTTVQHTSPSIASSQPLLMSPFPSSGQHAIPNPSRQAQHTSQQHLISATSRKLPPPASPVKQTVLHKLPSVSSQQPLAQPQKSPKNTPVPSPFVISPSPSPSHTPPLYTASLAPASTSVSSIPIQACHSFSVSQSSIRNMTVQTRSVTTVPSMMKSQAEVSHTQKRTFHQLANMNPNHLISSNTLSNSLGIASTSAGSSNRRAEEITEIKVEQINPNDDLGCLNSSSEEIPTISGLVGMEHKIMKEDIMLENSEDVKAQMGITTGADGCVGIPELLDGLVDIPPMYEGKSTQSGSLNTIRSSDNAESLYDFSEDFNNTTSTSSASHSEASTIKFEKKIVTSTPQSSSMLESAKRKRTDTSWDRADGKMFDSSMNASWNHKAHLEDTNTSVNNASLAEEATVYSCSECDKSFGTPSLLKRHSRKHTDFPHSCSSCDFKTKMYKELIVHRKVHATKHCKHCDFSTARSDTMKRHMVHHEKQDEFKCELCDYFANKNSLILTHVKNHHNSQMDLQTTSEVDDQEQLQSSQAGELQPES